MNPLSTEFEQLIERHRPYLMLLARARLRPNQGLQMEPSDIVQQTLIAAYEKRDQFRGASDAELTAWLRQILKNNLLDALRDQHRDKRDVRREISLQATVDRSFSRADDWLAAVQTSPSQKAMRQEDLLRLSEALTQLPEDQRNAIVLHHLHGLKLAEVASEMLRSESAVAGLLFRGLSKLNLLLSE